MIAFCSEFNYARDSKKILRWFTKVKSPNLEPENLGRSVLEGMLRTCRCHSNLSKRSPPQEDLYRHIDQEPRLEQHGSFYVDVRTHSCVLVEQRFSTLNQSSEART